MLTTSARLSLLLIVVGAGVSAAQAQQSPRTPPSHTMPDTVVQRVVRALAEGNAETLLTPATERVEVSLFGSRTFYSSAQAFYVLRDFFDAHPPVAFSLGDVTEAGRSGFVRGRLTHRRGDRPLQVYTRLVVQDKVWRLQELRIDADAE